MTTDSDTLATAFRARIDGLPNAAPHLAPWRPRVGVEPKPAKTETVALAVMHSLLGFIPKPAGRAFETTHSALLIEYVFVEVRCRSGGVHLLPAAPA